MQTTKVLLALLLALPSLACAPSDTKLPISVMKAEPTKNFPQTWEGLVLAGTSSSEVQTPIPEELQPKPGGSARKDSVALVIGIEHYRKNLRDASGAEADARIFSAFAEKTLGLDRRNIHLLLGADATKSSLDAEIGEWLVRNAKPTGEIFFYFAGHGAPEPKSKSSWLVPWDADPKYITSQGVSVDKLLAKLNQSHASSAFVFLDACFSGAGGRSVVPEGARPVVFRSATPKPAPQSRVVLVSATGPDEITGTVSSGNGLFSFFLFTGLNGAADKDANDTVTAEELFSYVSARVADESRRQGRDQVPQVSGLNPRLRAHPLTVFSAR